jgi:hypothetical protein
MDHTSSLVSLQIPKEVSQPIVAAKIQEAVTAALGGADKIVETLVHTICNTRVDPKTGKASQYSSENTTTWIDYHVTSIIEGAVKSELKNQLDTGAIQVKEALVKTLQSKGAANKFAEAILQSLTGTFAQGSKFMPDIKISFQDKSRY